MHFLAGGGTSNHACYFHNAMGDSQGDDDAAEPAV